MATIVPHVENDERIPITKLFLGEEELRAVQLPLESGWVVQGPYVESFETSSPPTPVRSTPRPRRPVLLRFISRSPRST